MAKKEKAVKVEPTKSDSLLWLLIDLARINLEQQPFGIRVKALEQCHTKILRLFGEQK